VNTFQIVILIGLLGNISFGLFVLLCNPKRVLNIGFAILSFLIVLWLVSMFFCSIPHSGTMQLFWIRQTSAAAGVLPLGFFFIYIVVANLGITLQQALYKLRYWMLACLAVVVLCHSAIFALSAKPVTPMDMVPPTEYGWGFSLFIAFFLAVIVAMTIGFWTGGKKNTGVQREELLFLQLGGCASLVFGVSFLIAAEILDNQQISGFIPLSVLILDGFVAYGIATRRIMSASIVVQRVVAYSLMICYLVALYIVTEWVAAKLFELLFADTTYIAHLLAALVVAFSVAPAHSWMQTVSHRLFASANLPNVDEILVRAAHIFQEVSTEETLVMQFSELIKEKFRTSDVFLLRQNEETVYSQFYPVKSGKKKYELKTDSAVVRLLLRDQEAFTTDTLDRMRPSSLVAGARKELETLSMAIALGIFLRKDLKAVLLLGQKQSGRIYDLREQRALQMLCDQLAVALENSNLYTAVQNGKIYNEILLDSLTSGIVAVDEDRKIIIFNQRAQKLTGLPESAVVNKPMTVLPPVLIEGLETVLNSDAGFRDKDRTIRLGEQELPIRVSGSMLRGYTGNLLGALLIFNDMTILKKMEEQIRRTDRLSSIGTLSAGMAHEIKNPLVTIKTFTQLLPHQYNDAEFRQTFFDLVGQEVTRIDTIVNRLLNFARPAPASLQPVSLHKVVDNSLRLIERQLVQNGIVLKRHLEAKYDIIEADAEQLNQTFINFFLNAIHAMTDGGTLTVRTSLAKHSKGTLQVGREGVRGRYIQLDIQDVGCGVPQDKLNKIFDPFFTTREGGVGLGLSVSHGIIQEHSGVVDVESKEGRGTVFHVQLPLIRSQQQQENKT
jgi:PAS domain S-box-containing protein